MKALRDISLGQFNSLIGGLYFTFTANAEDWPASFPSAPFTARFTNRCLLLGIPIISSIHSDASSEVQLTFRLQTCRGTSEDPEDYSDEYITRTTSWNCPLCDLHGRFGTQSYVPETY
ncbi:hypothetical protein PILCRDRAFT_341271 [Piloderma croceum F 1598]|uniref:Uncharacterized protein n=1 Tax=Piloderma croceum (strain F 1598) TaxID=765440 RepID=A0A0C3G4X8_PILCF|nr:hypothetical protein PILCRDRAFT_341271 [Piloderma croceum F 1598]